MLIIRLKKGSHAHRKFHNARVSGINAARFQRLDTFRNMLIDTKGGYSNFIRSFGRAKPSAFAERFGHKFPGALINLPVRHPRIRLDGFLSYQRMQRAVASASQAEGSTDDAAR